MFWSKDCHSLVWLLPSYATSGYGLCPCRIFSLARGWLLLDNSQPNLYTHTVYSMESSQWLWTANNIWYCLSCVVYMADHFFLFVDMHVVKIKIAAYLALSSCGGKWGRSDALTPDSSSSSCRRIVKVLQGHVRYITTTNPTSPVQGLPWILIPAKHAWEISTTRHHGCILIRCPNPPDCCECKEALTFPWALSR